MAALLVTTALLVAAMPARRLAAEPPAAAPPSEASPAWPASPWHGVIDGDGRTIPCRCRFAGREWRLGELVCMATHVGTVLARCDLVLNNTSWVPTSTPCTTSSRPGAGAARLASR